MVFSNRLAFLILLLSVVIIPLCADHEAFDIYTAPKRAAVELLGLALFVFFIYGLTGKKAARICFSPVGLPVGAFLVVGLTTLVYATNIWAGFDRLFFMLTAVFFFLAAPNLIARYNDEGGGWNDLEITGRGMKLSAVLNGVRVMEYDGDGTLNDAVHKKRNVGEKGHIALQIHRGDELKIRFKDIRIKELSK